ncbi:cytochrome P450 [Saccharothrix sp. Mg75]|uniref:cytochrome P450 n=1 Tax=Saccharothrix sp. Mg75 TaxID=3445357 RepID=UPI003EEA08C2
MSSPPQDLARFVSRDSRPDPYPVLRRLREAGPFTTDDGVVPVSGYHDCRTLLRHPAMSSERERARQSPTRRGPRTRNFLHLDPPDHTRLRGLVAKAFSPKVVQALRPRIRELAHGLLDEAADRGTFDVVADFAHPLPVRVICELLGVPYADRRDFLRWSAHLSAALEPPLPGLRTPEVGAEAARARAAFVAYFRDLLRRRRDEPGDDLVSGLLRVEQESDRLSESELLATCVMLVNAGHETTVNLIANGVLALLRHPAQLAEVRDDPELAWAAVEEVLRHDAPVQLVTRVATAPLSVGGAPVETGDLVLVLLAAANRDPAAYPDPDRFDLRRDRSTPSLAFAGGPHFCLGAGLARLEAAIAFELFADRVVAPRQARDTVEYKPNVTLRGPRALDVEFDAIRPARPEPGVGRASRRSG